MIDRLLPKSLFACSAELAWLARPSPSQRKEVKEDKRIKGETDEPDNNHRLMREHRRKTHGADWRARLFLPH
jgi:hypothetical protein